MEKLELNEGQFVFRAGDKAGQLFLLIAGEIGIFLPNNDSKEPNFYVGHSEIFGEMGVIEDKLRMAYAKCLTKCTIIAVTKAEYEKKVEEADPFLRGLLRLLSGRIRDIEKPQNLAKLKK